MCTYNPCQFVDLRLSLFFLLLLGIAPTPPPTAYIGLSPRGTDLRRADQKIEFAPLNRASQHAQPLGEGFFFNGCSTFGVTSLLTPHLNRWAGWRSALWAVGAPATRAESYSHFLVPSLGAEPPQRDCLVVPQEEFSGVHPGLPDFFLAHLEHASALAGAWPADSSRTQQIARPQRAASDGVVCDHLWERPHEILGARARHRQGLSFGHCLFFFAVSWLAESRGNQGAPVFSSKK